MKPTLSIIQGFLAAGKTTFSKQLARQTGALRLNADEYCESHFSPQQLESDWNACFSQAVTTLWQQAEAALAADQSVILDFGFWDIASRTHARNIARKTGVIFQHYYLATPQDIILQRLAQRQGSLAASNLANFAKLEKQFEPPTAEEKMSLLVVETT